MARAPAGAGHEGGPPSDGGGSGASRWLVAGAATAAGFLSLSPPQYRGVSDLGLIAGAGMLIALALNLTLLPALLSPCSGPRGFREAGGFGLGRAH
jgi:uncharacterized protein